MENRDATATIITPRFPAIRSCCGRAPLPWRRVKVHRGQLGCPSPQELGKLDPNVSADQKVFPGSTSRRSQDSPGSIQREPERSVIGWSVQAGIHSYRCQHGNWWFLPWHRMYLYFFERIMRAAVGDDFALPYWDWTDPNQSSLPAAFRDSSSPLFDSNRLEGVNSGAFSLNWSGYEPWGETLSYSVNLPDFVPDFGSQAVTTPGSYPQHVRLKSVRTIRSTFGSRGLRRRIWVSPSTRCSTLYSGFIMRTSTGSGSSGRRKWLPQLIRNRQTRRGKTRRSPSTMRIAPQRASPSAKSATRRPLH